GEQPEDREVEDVQPLVPDTRHPDVVRLGRDADRGVGVGAEAEAEHHHQELTETPPPHVVIVHGPDLPARPPADSDHGREIAGEEHDVEHSHPKHAGVPFVSWSSYSGMNWLGKDMEELSPDSLVLT